MLTEKGKLNIVILFNFFYQIQRSLWLFYYGQVHILKVDKMENLMTTLKIDS